MQAVKQKLIDAINAEIATLQTHTQGTTIIAALVRCISVIQNTDLTECQSKTPEYNRGFADARRMALNICTDMDPEEHSVFGKTVAECAYEIGHMVPDIKQDATAPNDAARWKFFLSKIILSTLARRGTRWFIEAYLPDGPDILTLENAIDAGIHALPVVEATTTFAPQHTDSPDCKCVGCQGGDPKP